MNDAAIAAATGVQPSTFHRWQRAEGTKLPTLDKVEQFCTGLEIPASAAYAALGINDTREPTPASPLDPDLRQLARILADPNVAEAEKLAIRHTIRMLARAARAANSAEPEPAE